MNFDKILVPVDFGECSDKAVQYALKLAERLEAEITLLNVDEFFQWLLPEESYQPGEVEDALKTRQQLLQQQLQPYLEMGKERNLKVEYAIMRGDSVAEKILQRLHEEKYGLVVMGTHGRTGLKHLFLGSIAEKVVRFSPTPVLTLHKSVECCRMEHILVAVDFSDYSRQALEYAAAFARLAGPRITVLHVIERIIYPAFYPEGYYPVADFEPKLREQVLENLHAFCADYGDIDITTAAAAGRASDEICHFAAENGVDLIIMATRGLSGLQHLIVGSTAERVVRMSSAPVFTVRTAEEHSGEASTN